jgi:hypothetical protein
VAQRQEAGGLNALADQSCRTHASPGRIAPDVEALICEVRRHHRRWSAGRIADELTLEIGQQAPSRSTTHRVLVRTGLVNCQEQQHERVYKRWARESAQMNLWQLDVVGRAFLVNGHEHQILTAIDETTPCWRRLKVGPVATSCTLPPNTWRRKPAATSTPTARQRYDVPITMRHLMS